MRKHIDNLRQFISEAKQIEWGFDLTDFGTAAKFKKIVDEFGLKYSRVLSPWSSEKSDVPGREPHYEFHWEAPGILIVTANNPITGEFNNPNQREPEKGYASYIGLTGDEEKVKKAVSMIKKLGVIKDESPGNRDFI